MVVMVGLVNLSSWTSLRHICVLVNSLYPAGLGLSLRQSSDSMEFTSTQIGQLAISLKNSLNPFGIFSKRGIYYEF